MTCDLCPKQTEERFNKMVLCTPCQERVKAHRSATLLQRQSAAPEARLQGRKLAAQGSAKKKAA